MDLEREVLKVIDSSDYETAVYLEDMHGNVIKHNETVVYNSASTIKTFVLVEFFRQLYAGEISEEDSLVFTEADDIVGAAGSIVWRLGHGFKMTVRQCATLMIIVSDNIATNMMIDFLGVDKINENIRRMGFKNTELFHPMDSSKYDDGIGQISLDEYAKLFKDIYNGEAVSPEVSAECLNILKKQLIHKMTDRGIPAYERLFRKGSSLKYIASKSGSWTTKVQSECIRLDGGIISTKKGDFIYAVAVNNVDDIESSACNKGIEQGGKIIGLAYEQIVENDGSFK